jgi:hypothetical protein
MRSLLRLSSLAPAAGYAGRSALRAAAGRWAHPFGVAAAVALLVCACGASIATPSPLAAPAAPDRAVPAAAADAHAGEIATNRRFEALPPAEGAGDLRAQLAAAGLALGDLEIVLAGVPLSGDDLGRWARTPEGEPLLRAVREDVGRAVRLEDFLFFIDDVLVADRAGRRGEGFYVTPGRARAAGVLVHPDEVFGGRTRRYGAPEGWLDVTKPRPQAVYPPAEDGAPLGPAWTMRFRHPQDEPAMLEALRARRPGSDFADRLELLMAQLRASGARVQLESTVRLRERGYLMWGSFELARQHSAEEIEAMCARLDALNREWGLDVPIRWRDPRGWQATREAARGMADTYDVVFASEAGARDSSHYGGGAVDLTAVALPRVLELEGPDGERRRFDLSAPDETRELSLTPALVAWVERAYGFQKLRADYPHWNDAPIR